MTASMEKDFDALIKGEKEMTESKIYVKCAECKANIDKAIAIKDEKDNLFCCERCRDMYDKKQNHTTEFNYDKEEVESSEKVNEAEFKSDDENPKEGDQNDEVPTADGEAE